MNVKKGRKEKKKNSVGGQTRWGRDAASPSAYSHPPAAIHQDRNAHESSVSAARRKTILNHTESHQSAFGTAR